MTNMWSTVWTNGMGAFALTCWSFRQRFPKQNIVLPACYLFLHLLLNHGISSHDASIHYCGNVQIDIECQYPWPSSRRSWNEPRQDSQHKIRQQSQTYRGMFLCVLIMNTHDVYTCTNAHRRIDKDVYACTNTHDAYTCTNAHSRIDKDVYACTNTHDVHTCTNAHRRIDKDVYACTILMHTDVYAWCIHMY